MPGRAATIWNLIAPQRRLYLAAVAALITASCFLYLAPLVPQIVIDGVLTGGDAADTTGEPSAFVQWAVERLGGRDYIASNLWWPALILVGITALAGLFTYLRGRWAARASESIVRTVRDRLHEQLEHLPCRYHDSAKTGDLVQRCTSDVETLRVFLANQVVEIGRAIIMLVVPIPLMLAIDVRMTIAATLLLPLVVGFSLVYFPRIRRTFKASDEAEGRMTTVIQENLTGIRVVRAFARQDYERRKFGQRNREHQELDYRLYVLLARFWAISDLICLAQLGLVIGAGVWWLAAGQLQVGAFYFFITAVNMFLWPARMMGRILSDLGKAMVALGRIREILDEPRETEPEAPAPTSAVPPRGEIVFDDVSFAHGAESPVLRGVSFAVQPGQTLAIMGPSGSGKSTIVNLLLRLYDYDAGSIRLDGQELATIPRKEARGRAAVVMQEPFLFSKTLRENITLGRPGAREDQMIEAAAIAAVHESILQFEQGYESLVGERGVTLSGGQRQRVALARALLQEPAVLVLDDALSAVDTDTEAMILDALRQRHGRQTTIVIAHRLSTLMHADQILVLETGRVVQSGTHRELSAVPGLYRRLWEIQGQIEGAEHELAGPPSRGEPS